MNPKLSYLSKMASAMPDLMLAMVEERHRPVDAMCDRIIERQKAKTRHDFEAVAKAVAKRLRKLEAKALRTP